MSGYFDDLALGDGFTKCIREGVLSQEEALISATFHQLADEYRTDGDDRRALSDTEWRAVTREARHLWKALKGSASDPEDQAIMRELERRFGGI